MGVDLHHPQEYYAEMIDALLQPGDRWLEIGCGRQIVPDWAMDPAAQRKLVSRSSSVTGIDVDSAIHEHPLLTHRVLAIGNAMPFRPGSFDFVSANVVMEHVDDPARLLSEVGALLSPGGAFTFHTPNYHHPLVLIASMVPRGIKTKIVYLLERRAEEDVFPTFYRMNTIDDIHRFAEQAGFSVERMDLVGPYGLFGLLGPLGVLELPMLRMYGFSFMRPLRSSFIVTLRKRR
jgi:SAM-dependent methyltransferase